MRLQPRAFVEPQDANVPIWRYMDFAKFVSLLDRGALFFCRADLLGDPFEGSLSSVTHSARTEWLKKEGGMNPEASKAFAQMPRWVREWTFVSCWHVNEHESAAMWKLYSASSEAVAVESSYRSLLEALPTKPPAIYTGLVKYVDYEEHFIPVDDMFSPTMHKRRSFEHEKELRAVWQDLPSKEYDPPRPRKTPQDATGYIPVGEKNEERGRYVNVDLPKLVRRVLVAPTAPAWFRDLVQSVVKKYGLNADVVQSALDAKPLF